MALLDADADAATGRFANEVETIRTGTILAHDQKAYTHWRTDVARKSGRPTGKGLKELTRDFGVERGGFEFRN